MPRNTDSENLASEAPGQKRVRRDVRDESKIYPASSKAGQEGSSQPPKRAPIKSNPPSESSGAIVKVAPSQAVQIPPGRTNLSIFSCFGRAGTGPPNGNPGSAIALSQSGAIAAALESGQLPSLPPAAHEDRNPSHTHVPAEPPRPKEISHPPSEPVVHKASASAAGIATKTGTSRKAADPIPAEVNRNAKKARPGTIPRKPASSHGTPKKLSPAGTPRSPSRERIVVVPASSNATTNTKTLQQSIPSSKLAIACACTKGRSPIGQSGSQKSKVQAKMSRGGGSGPVEEGGSNPIGLRQPRRAGKAIMIGGGEGGGGDRDMPGGSGSPSHSPQRSNRDRKGKKAVEEDDLEPALGDIILRHRPTRDNEDETSKPKMITFFYHRDETVFRKFDHLLRHRFHYNELSDKMVLKSTLYRYLPGILSEGDDDRLRWIHIDNAKKSLRMFSQNPNRPPFADSFRFVGGRNEVAGTVVIDR